MTSDVDERYRREQEEFVSNHGGSSSREVVLAILPNICAILLTATTMALFGKRLNRHLRNFLEFCLNIVPCVLCCTIFSEFVISVCLTILSISLVNVFILVARKNNETIVKSYVHTFIGRRPFVTNFRALVNIITAVCILAVDFHIFPRKFAKTEIYGYSLMDTGVGLFVVANALVAPESRSFDNDQCSTNKCRSLIHRMTVNSRVCVKNSAPLLILGLGRFVAIEYSSYQTHVTEYGVHWNFFVTLAFVKMLTSTLSTFVDSRYSLVSGIIIVFMHEYALGTGGLKNWILGNSPRTDFVSANREGLSSVPGYVGLYLVGIAVGRLIHSTYDNRDNKLRKNERYSVNISLFGNNVEFYYNSSMILCVKLSLIAVQACALTIYCDSYYRVSRRLANAGYCCWIITLSCTLLTLLLLVEIKTDIIANIAASERLENNGRKDSRDEHGRRKKHVGFKLDEGADKIVEDNEEKMRIRVPEIFEAVNYNGLGFFLLANLLTGIVNISVKTLYADTNKSVQIIVVYMGICALVTLVLYRYKIQLRL